MVVEKEVYVGYQDIVVHIYLRCLIVPGCQSPGWRSEHNSEEQYGVFGGWLREVIKVGRGRVGITVVQVHVQVGWLVCNKSCIPVVGRENSLCMFSGAPGVGSQWCLHGEV